MISPRWRKIMRDLWLNLSRTVIVVLAMAIGIFGVGFVMDTYAILSREIDTNYRTSNPPSATLWLDKVDARAVALARRFPGVTLVDAARPPIRGRVRVGPNQWDILLLYVADDFHQLRVGKFFPEKGGWPPGDREILIERASLPIIRARIGKPITMRILNAEIHQVPVTGVVYDPSPDPAWVNDITSGYITPNTLKWLGGTPPEKGLRIVVSKNSKNRSHIRNVANRLRAALQRNGYRVNRVEVPLPGKYQQTDKSNSILLTLVAFGVLSLLLSGFITALLVTALLAQQVRQIGVMKALGARTGQTMGIYIGMVLSMSFAALIISIPLAAAAGKSFAFSTLAMLNFNVTHGAIPMWAFAVQTGLGILVPLFTVLYPVFRGSSITVQEAIRDAGISRKNFGTSRIDTMLAHIQGPSRLFTLSLRNTFRRRGRMSLALLMLAVGGASFIASLGSAASWNKTIDNSFANINYDIDIRLGKQYPAAAIEQSIRGIPGVKTVEAWGYNMSSAFPKYSDGTYGPSYAVFAPKKGSSLINPPVVAGRWLRADDSNAIVLDTEFIDNAANLGTPVQVGDDLILNLAGKDIAWHVVGIMDKIGLQSAAYTNYDYFAAVTRQPGKAMCARVLVTGHDKTLQKTVTRAIEQKLAQDKMNIFAIQPLTATRQVMVNHVVLILSLLMVMSIMTAAIGALGLASAMSVNVLERTREIGIMRSIGATSKAILQTVVMEGLSIGLLSWLLGTVISIPLTDFIARNTGQFIFPRIMVIVYPLWAPLLWLAIVYFISIAASFNPAWKATRLTIREVLTYE